MLNTPINISFAVGDVIFVIICGLCIVALSYLILFLKEAYISLRTINKIYSKNSVAIDSIIEDSSKITRKISAVSESIPDEPLAFLDNIKTSVPMIGSLLSAIGNKIFSSKSK